MPDLPIKRMVLYKHGVGFFERYGTVGDSAQVELVFKKNEMNDVLKSLVAFPQGDGQVINVSYETPEDKRSALDKAPIFLSQDTALLDLLRSLRGRHIRLHLVDANLMVQEGRLVESTIGAEFAVSGTLLGIDADVGFDKGRVSLLPSQPNPDEDPQIRTYRLPQLRGVDVLDPQSGDDLRYILELSRATGDKRSVTILLNQPQQPLLVSYITPTPTWRVSYRLVYTADPPAADRTEATGQVFLQGWGVVDNQLDEDLEAVDLTLIAGQPISFVYDLYTPRLIQRPQVKDEERTVTGPIMFEEALSEVTSDDDSFASFDIEPGSALFADGDDLFGAGEPLGRMYTAAPGAIAAGAIAQRSLKRNLASTTQVQATGIARGELFQYDVSNPVSIKRGQSAMVPILGSTLAGRKEHIYNQEKVADNPVVTIMLSNTTGLTLERGPVTVLENENYVGEAVIAFTPAEGELFVPYAVDLGVRITPTDDRHFQTAAIRFGYDDYLIRDEYQIEVKTYQIENRNPDPIQLVIEHRISENYELFDTLDPIAQTAEFYRWRIPIPSRTKMDFPVRERRLLARREVIRGLGHKRLSEYLENQLIDQAVFQQLQEILDLYDQKNQNQQTINQYTQQRGQLANELKLAAEKLQPLGKTGSEGELRKRYVTKMQEMEDESDRLAQSIATLEAHNIQLQQEIETQLQRLNANA